MIGAEPGGRQFTFPPSTHACQPMLPFTSGPAQSNPRRLLIAHTRSYETEGVLGST